MKPNEHKRELSDIVADMLAMAGQNEEPLDLPPGYLNYDHHHRNLVVLSDGDKGVFVHDEESGKIYFLRDSKVDGLMRQTSNETQATYRELSFENEAMIFIRDESGDCDVQTRDWGP